MYDIFRSTIISGEFELNDMLYRIKKSWAMGDISEDQMNELMALARDRANPEQSSDLYKMVMDLTQRVDALEKKVNGGEGGGGEPTDQYPEFVEGKAYFTGDKITYNGVKYECIAPKNVACVWSPDAYPAFWKKVETVQPEPAATV